MKYLQCHLYHMFSYKPQQHLCFFGEAHVSFLETLTDNVFNHSFQVMDVLLHELSHVCLIALKLCFKLFTDGRIQSAF